MQTLDAIYGRRSIRAYTDQMVSEENLVSCLEAATMAPSGVNLQPWYFVAIRSEEKLQELLEVVSESAHRFLPVLEKRFQDHPEIIDETMRFIRSLGGAKTIVLVFLLRPQYPDPQTMIESVAAAVQNLLLAAHDKGIGSCFLTAPVKMGIGDALREQFARDKGEFLGLVTLGYPARTPKAPQRREGRYTII